MKWAHKQRHGPKTAPDRLYRGKLSRPPKRFGRSVGVTRAILDGSTSHSQSGDVCQGIQISSAVAITKPKAHLPGSLKAGIVPLTFGTQRVSTLEAGTVPVNGKAVVRGDSFVHGCRDSSQFQTGGKDNKTSGGCAHCPWFSHPCA